MRIGLIAIIMLISFIAVGCSSTPYSLDVKADPGAERINSGHSILVDVVPIWQGRFGDSEWKSMSASDWFAKEHQRQASEPWIATYTCPAGSKELTLSKPASMRVPTEDDEAFEGYMIFASFHPNPDKKLIPPTAFLDRPVVEVRVGEKNLQIVAPK